MANVLVVLAEPILSTILTTSEHRPRVLEESLIFDFLHDCIQGFVEDDVYLVGLVSVTPITPIWIGSGTLVAATAPGWFS